MGYLALSSVVCWNGGRSRGVRDIPCLQGFPVGCGNARFCIHTAEATGSIPVSPTLMKLLALQGVSSKWAMSLGWSAAPGPFKRHGGLSHLGLLVQPPSLIPVSCAPRPHCVRIRVTQGWVVGVGDMADLGGGEEPLLGVLDRDGSSRHTAHRPGVADRVCVKDRSMSLDSPRQYRAKRTMTPLVSPQVQVLPRLGWPPRQCRIRVGPSGTKSTPLEQG
jgi:hypothetical protein